MELKHEYKIVCSAKVLGIKRIKAGSLKEALRIARSESKIKFYKILKQNDSCKVEIDLSRKANESLNEFSYDKYRHHDSINYLNWGSE
jgi:hypothetical protein